MDLRYKIPKHYVLWVGAFIGGGGGVIGGGGALTRGAFIGGGVC